MALEPQRVSVLQPFKGHIKLHLSLPVTSMKDTSPEIIEVSEKYINLSGNAYSFQLEQCSLWTLSTLLFCILVLICIP